MPALRPSASRSKSCAPRRPTLPQLATVQWSFVAELESGDRTHAVGEFRKSVQDISATLEGAAALQRFNTRDALGALAMLDKLQASRKRDIARAANIDWRKSYVGLPERRLIAWEHVSLCEALRFGCCATQSCVLMRLSRRCCTCKVESRMWGWWCAVHIANQAGRAMCWMRCCG